MEYTGMYNRGGLDSPSHYVQYSPEEANENEPDEQDLFACLEDAGVDPANYELVEIEILHDGTRRAIFHHI